MGLMQAIKECCKCDLSKTATNKVVGMGSDTPAIIVIGEAPGAEEDQKGMPFVGAAGKILRPLLESTGLLFTILNILKCRPPDNRKPSSREVGACLPWLHEQVERLRKGQKVTILLLGKTAYDYISRDHVTNWNGRPCETIYGPGFALYHPAAILHAPSKKPAFEDGWYDFKAYLDLAAPRLIQPFTQLHVHTEHSYRDSVNRLDNLIEAAVQKGFKHLAITDHYHCAGIFKFYYLCKEAGINPILGIEANYARTLTDDPGHITIVARSYKGLQNLFKAIYYSALDAEAIRKPKDHQTILEKHLFTYNEDLYVFSGCLGGAIIPLEQKSPGYLQTMKDVFGDRFFLEVMPVPVMFDRVREIAVYARKYNIPFITTNDAHFIDKSWEKTHHILTARGKKIIDAPSYEGPYWLKTWDEMVEGLPDDILPIIQAGQAATMRVAESTHIELPTNPHIPTLEGDVRAQLRAILPNESELSVLYQERLKKEMDIIESKGFQTYFLMIYGIVKYARSRGIEIECRGSVGGSLIAYLLSWTNVDPVEHDIMFERFLSPDRQGLPDIDLDIDARYRMDVISEYIKPTYGADNVAYHTVQASRFQRKTAIADVGKYYDVDPRLIELAKETEDLTKVEGWPLEAIEHVMKLEGQAKTSTVHSGAVIVADKPICEYAPIEYRTSKQGKKGEAVLTVGTDHESCEKIGLVKFDLLSQKCLAVIKECCELMDPGVRDAFQVLDTNDPAIWHQYALGNMAGIFQVEGVNMTETIKEVKPKSLGELADCIALYRPGSIQAKFLEMYLGNQGNPILAPWCGNTRNCVLYQEQVMAIFHGMGGLPMTEVDKARRIISKKKKGELEKMQERFITGATGKGYAKPDAEAVFNQLVNFSGYAFNKAHAYLYAMRSFRMMYLKTHCPVEFAIASMKWGDPDLGSLIVELRERGIVVQDPDINTSMATFAKGPDNSILGALTSVKNIKQETAESIIAGRPYHSFTDIKAMVTETQLQCLAKARALRSIYADHRKAVMLVETGGNLPLDYDNTPYSALDSYLARESVVDYPSYEHPVSTLDLTPYVRLVKIKDIFCVGQCIALIRKMKGESRRVEVIVEDSSGTWKMHAWQNKGSFSVQEGLGTIQIMTVQRSKFGYQIVGMDGLEPLVDEKDYLCKPISGRTAFGKITGHIASVEVFKTRAKQQEMCVLYVENLDGGGKVTVFPSDYDKYKNGCKRGKTLTDLPIKEGQYVGEFTANLRGW